MLLFVEGTKKKNPFIEVLELPSTDIKIGIVNLLRRKDDCKIFFPTKKDDCNKECKSIHVYRAKYIK